MTAATRQTPTVLNGGNRSGSPYLDAVNVEVGALWKGAAFGYLINVAGTGNAVTATSDTSLVAAIAAYARPMAFWYAPANANSGAVTMNIDAVGVINVKDQFGAALQGGEFQTTGIYPLVFDGTNLRAVTVTAGAANRPVTQPDVIAQEQQTSGTNGHANAAFTSGAYRTRFLTTLVRNNISASLASYQVTLPAGTYFAQWRCPGYALNGHQTRLYNATDSSVIAYGSTAYNNTDQGDSVGSASFTITSSKAIEIDHRSASTNTPGFGKSAGFGNIEIYSELRLWKQ